MCARDPLFWVNSFVWTYDPRLKQSVVPFVTYASYQDETILAIVDSIESGGDVLIEKSRDMGASWLCLLVFTWYWHFHPEKSFLVASRKEDLVDKTDDPDSLFWKIDFILKWEPSWLAPIHERTSLHFLNVENDSTIDGASTTSDTARGDTIVVTLAASSRTSSRK